MCCRGGAGGKSLLASPRIVSCSDQGDGIERLAVARCPGFLLVEGLSSAFRVMLLGADDNR